MSIVTFRSFFSWGLAAGVEIILFTAPKALRPGSSGVLKVLAFLGDFNSFSGGRQVRVRGQQLRRHSGVEGMQTMWMSPCLEQTEAAVASLRRKSKDVHFLAQWRRWPFDLEAQLDTLMLFRCHLSEQPHLTSTGSLTTTLVQRKGTMSLGRVFIFRVKRSCDVIYTSNSETLSLQLQDGEMLVKMTCQDWMEQRHAHLHLPSLQMLNRQ